MINFNNPSKWVILRYRPASGGKFLCSCLLTINKIAHWDKRVQSGKLSFQSWVDGLWNDGPWIVAEPMHDWGNTFFSRTFPRGNDITVEEYNIQMNANATDYAKEIWDSELLLLDFINKKEFPNWWKDSFHLSLDADVTSRTYRQLLLTKLFPYDFENKLGYSLMDKPINYSSTNKTLVESNINATKYSNPWQFKSFDSEDDWYKHVLEHDFRINFDLDQPNIYLEQLLDFTHVEEFISKVAIDLNSSYNKEDLQYIHNFWLDKNKKYANFIDTT